MFDNIVRSYFFSCFLETLNTFVYFSWVTIVIILIAIADFRIKRKFDLPSTILNNIVLGKTNSNCLYYCMLVYSREVQLKIDLPLTTENPIFFMPIIKFPWWFYILLMVADTLGTEGGSSWVSEDQTTSPSSSCTTPNSTTEAPDSELSFTVGVTDGTPHACRFCDKAFPRHSYLKKHEQVKISMYFYYYLLYE